MLRALTCIAALAACAGSLAAQTEPSRGFAFGTNYQASANALGFIGRWDTSAGFYFKRHWQIDVGVPFYSLLPSAASEAAGITTTHGLGNVYTQIRFTRLHPVVNYMSTLTVTAPTGDRDKGLTTGRVTADWGHYFDRSFARLTPFGEIGFANSVSDTTFFVRPYTTLGFLTRAQAGARLRFAPWASVGASGYLIEPAGSQTVYSRVVRRRVSGGQEVVPGVGLGLLRKPVFEEVVETTGTAGIARDRGFSGFLVFGRNPGVNLYAGFTRSTEFRLNTAFFGIGYNLRRPLGDR
jgi:hypothetical protein